MDRLGTQLAARKGLVLEASLEAVRYNLPEDRMDGAVYEHHEAVRSPDEEVQSTEEVQAAALARRSGQEVRGAEVEADSSDLGGRIRRREEQREEDGSHARPPG